MKFNFLLVFLFQLYSIFMLPTINVALAEDHPIIRNGITEFLKTTNCRVSLQAANGRDLIDQLQTTPTLPDVCILDINMPVMNGYQTIKAIRHYYTRLKVLVYSQYESEYSILRMIKDGANGYISKESTVDELAAAITDIHTKGCHYSSIADQKKFHSARYVTIPEFTDRELLFLKYLCSGTLCRDISKLLNVSIRTIEDYQKKICEKVGLHSRLDLALFAISSGLVDPQHPPA